MKTDRPRRGSEPGAADHDNSRPAERVTLRHAPLAARALVGVAAAVVLAAAGWTGWASTLQDPLGVSLESTVLNRAHVRVEVETLDRRLHDLLATLEDTRVVEGEARMLAGLEPAEPAPAPADDRSFYPATCIEDPDLARGLVTSAIHLDRAVELAGALKRSYGDVLEGMQLRAEAWESIPSIFPVDCARLTSSYGSRRDPITGRRARHTGMDLAAPYGAPIRASASGEVVRAGWIRGYGKLIELDHGNGIVTRYAHNSRILVKRGERVRRGQVIGRLGATGRVNAPHLHYEVLVDGRRVNPYDHTLSLAE